VRKAEACQSEVPFKCSPLGQTPGFTRKHYTWLSLARDEHSSLFSLSIDEEEVSFIALTPEANIINFFVRNLCIFVVS
jgi:hypothetical protein